MNVSIFDRALGAIAPRLAAKRIYAKTQLAAMRSYAGAATGRHTDGWRTAGTSADAEIALAGAKLRDRSRDLTRNNPHAAKALSSWVSNVVGDGISPRIKDAKLKALWQAWVKQCDADGQLDWYGMQTLACREMIEGGEVLVRRRQRLASDGLTVPLQIQILESDFIDSSKNGDTSGGGVAINGIEFNGIGRRTAYWLWAQHPGNHFASFNSRLSSAPVPATEIAHLYEKQRTQTRGVPWCSPVVRKLRDLDDYEFAEMLRKKTEACVVGIVTGFDEQEMGVAPAITDSAGRTIEKFQPGMFAYARGGKDIHFNTPSASGGFAEYHKLSIKTIAAGYRIPYELLSGDLSEVNYSSMRASLVEFRRSVSAAQWQIVIPAFCERVWGWFTEAAWLAGLIPQPVVAVEWSVPKFDWVDPYKDVLADILAIRAGIRSWEEVVSETGRDPEAVLEEIAALNARLDDLGIVLDTDPRTTGKSGMLQQAPTDNAPADQQQVPPQKKGRSEDDDVLRDALALALSRENETRHFPALIDAVRRQQPMKLPNTTVNVPPPAPPPPRQLTRKVITRDDDGRIVRIDEQEVA